MIYLIKYINKTLSKSYYHQFTIIDVNKTIEYCKEYSKKEYLLSFLLVFILTSSKF